MTPAMSWYPRFTKALPVSVNTVDKTRLGLAVSGLAPLGLTFISRRSSLQENRARETIIKLYKGFMGSFIIVNLKGSTKLNPDRHYPRHDIVPFYTLLELCACLGSCLGLEGHLGVNIDFGCCPKNNVPAIHRDVRILQPDPFREGPRKIVSQRYFPKLHKGSIVQEGSGKAPCGTSRIRH